MSLCFDPMPKERVTIKGVTPEELAEFTSLNPASNSSSIVSV
jgi:hypothetical protein